MKSLSIPEVTPEWVCYRRALGFSVLIKKLQQVRKSERGYMYNAPTNMFIYADGNCMPRFDAINKISSGISLINSCRMAGSHATHMQLCKLLHEVKNDQCTICPTRFWWKHDGPRRCEKSQKVTATVEGSGPLFKKKSILLFAFRKSSRPRWKARYSTISF